MNNRLFKKLAAGAVSTMLAFMSIPSVPSALAYQETGTKDGYDWELWNQDGIGNASMTVGNAGTYECSWSGIQNALFRSGKKWNNNPQWTSLDGIAVDYEVDYRPNGNSYLCIYGWMTEPTVEYYICDSYGTWRPPGNGFQLKGTRVIDGGTYEIYEGTHTGPSIFSGNETFNQYWSIRVDGQLRTKGTITVSEHFKAWEECGIKLGGLHEVALNVEGYMSSGSAKVIKNDLRIGIGDTGSATEPIKPAEPDANGYYFHSTFEDGTDSWKGRGAASVKQSSGALSVTGRTDSWNGASYSLDPNTFIAGETYAFSVNAKQNDLASEDFKLTLQCNVGGEEQYINVAEGSAAKGEWVQLVNNSFTIPKGATNLLLYVETADTTTDFVIDDAIGAVEGKIPVSGTQPGTSDTPSAGSFIRGDLNGDGRIDVYDVVLERQAVISTFAGSATNKAADIDGDGNVSMNDLVLLSQFVLGEIKTFPAASTTKPAATTTKNEPVSTTSTTKAPSGNTGSGKDYMESVSITNNVPSNITGSENNECKEERITYFSSVANKNKKAVVILPPGYTTSKKYPVVYVNHGIMGSEGDMVGYCKSIGGNLMKSGEAEEMILVSCAMYTSQTSDVCSGITAEECAKYDAFREDLIECLMPYIEENYSVKTGRENTGICGFSMGGRESLYIGITRPQYFGYIGAASPAPGITPAQDMFMVHPGNMQPSEFKVQDHTYDPYFLMITGGTNDMVVGTFPKEYHDMLTANGQPHIWQEIQGGGHDASCINPLMYNFLKYAFKAT